MERKSPKDKAAIFCVSVSVHMCGCIGLWDQATLVMLLQNMFVQHKMNSSTLAFNT